MTARPGWRDRLNSVHVGVISTQARWTLVSTSLSLLVAGSVTLMAVGTLPVTPPLVGQPTHTPIAYGLFMKLVQAGGANALIPRAAPTGDENAAAPQSETRTITLDRGDTLAGAMEDQGVSAADTNAAISALGKDFNPRGLRAGMTFDLTYSLAPVIDATGKTANRKKVAEAQLSQPAGSETISRLLSLHFSPTVDEDVTVTRTTDGGFTAARTHKQLEVHRHLAGATIDSSLYLAGMQAGIPADIVVELIRLFSYKVDFQRELQPGDSFEVYYDSYYTPEGQLAKDGDILYARLKLSGRDIALYRFQPDPDGPADYFNAKGQSAKGLLMKTPVDGARISSGFGRRFHPILGYTRMHKGVDFAVPTGTPVMAAGAGQITFMGWANGYGNFVIINHGNGYATAYGHLSRFAAGMHRGSHVRQGQVFAYSGSTGLATGPHLHYEIRINHRQVNPLTVKVAEGRKLNGKELRQFEDERTKIDAMIAATPLEPKVADISADLRHTTAQ